MRPSRGIRDTPSPDAFPACGAGELKAHGRYGKVPVVFYSRKITPEDVLRVLEAGAVDAIRKGYPGDDPRAQRDWVLRPLDRAQHVHRLLSAYQPNVNTTLFPP